MLTLRPQLGLFDQSQVKIWIIDGMFAVCPPTTSPRYIALVFNPGLLTDHVSCDTSRDAIFLFSTYKEN